jgi:hypothetical protein
VCGDRLPGGRSPIILVPGPYSVCNYDYLKAIKILNGIPQSIHSYAQLWLPIFIHLGTSAQHLWTLPTFSELANMTREDLTSPVAAAATSQVTLCLTMRRNRIFGSASSRPSCSGRNQLTKLKYANALASLPKQVLQHILDTLDVCSDSDKPFDFLKNTLLGQFGKSKWQSYFELLRLPMEMQGLKPSVLMGKLKQHLPPGVSPNNDLYLAKFLIRLPPSKRETVGAGAHGMAATMVKAADALWDARGSHDPTVAAASTQQSRSPAPSSGKRGDKRGSNACPESQPPSLPDFHSIQNPGNCMSKFHNYYVNRANRCIPPLSWSEN